MTPVKVVGCLPALRRRGRRGERAVASEPSVKAKVPKSAGGLTGASWGEVGRGVGAREVLGVEEVVGGGAPPSLARLFWKNFILQKAPNTFPWEVGGEMGGAEVSSKGLFLV